MYLSAIPCGVTQSKMTHRYNTRSSTARVDDHLVALLQALTIQQRQIDALLDDRNAGPATLHAAAPRPATATNVRNVRGGPSRHSHRTPHPASLAGRGPRLCGAPCSSRPHPCRWASLSCPHLGHAWWRWGRGLRDCDVVACPRHPRVLRERCRHCNSSTAL